MPDLTNAMIAAGPGACRINSGDWYVVEDLIYPFDFGNAIQNDVPGGSIRIFGMGHRLLNLPGGGPYNGTRAVGINLIGCHVEIYQLQVGLGPELGKFNIGIQLPTYYSNGRPDYSRTPGRHYLSRVDASGWVYGMQVMGDDCIYDTCFAGNCGGSSFYSRPIGIDHWGRRPILSNCFVRDMVKGAYDLETMNYHFEDADGGDLRGCVGRNAVRNPGSYGIWWNTTAAMNANALIMEGMETVLAGDLAAGTLQGSASNYTTLSTLPPGPVVDF